MKAVGVRAPRVGDVLERHKIGPRENVTDALVGVAARQIRLEKFIERHHQYLYYNMVPSDAIWLDDVWSHLTRDDWFWLIDEMIDVAFFVQNFTPPAFFFAFYLICLV